MSALTSEKANFPGKIIIIIIIIIIIKVFIEHPKQTFEFTRIRG